MLIGLNVLPVKYWSVLKKGCISWITLTAPHSSITINSVFVVWTHLYSALRNKSLHGAGCCLWCGDTLPPCGWTEHVHITPCRTLTSALSSIPNISSSNIIMVSHLEWITLPVIHQTVWEVMHFISYDCICILYTYHVLICLCVSRNCMFLFFLVRSDQSETWILQAFFYSMTSDKTTWLKGAVHLNYKMSEKSWWKLLNVLCRVLRPIWMLLRNVLLFGCLKVVFQ